MSSFGVGGTKPTSSSRSLRPSDCRDRSRSELLLLSARSAVALDRTTTNLMEHFRRDPSLALQMRLSHCRPAGSPPSANSCLQRPCDAVEALGGRHPTRVFSRAVPDRAPDVAFMFPGQGAHT